MLLLHERRIPEVRSLTDGARTSFGASEPVYATDESGRRWVRKVVGRGELLAECLGWGLSMELRIPTPPCAVYVREERPSFLSAVIDDVLHWSPSRPQSMRTPDDLGAILALDAIVANGDRNEGNLLFRPSSDGLDVYSIDLANAAIGAPIELAGLEADPPRLGSLVDGIPVALVTPGAAGCAAAAAQLSEDALVERVREACHIAGCPDVDGLVTSLKLRCRLAPDIVHKYLTLIKDRT